jgi:hypothetical protein
MKATIWCDRLRAGEPADGRARLAEVVRRSANVTANGA